MRESSFGSSSSGDFAEVTTFWKPRVLREYSFIADGERGALVGPDGGMVWMCMPQWDSPAIFSTLLGGHGGYAVTPADERYVWGGRYESGSLIWRSRWVSRGITECREALAMPADPHRCMILRRVEARDQRAKVTVTLDVRAAFGRQPMADLSRAQGCWTGRSAGIKFRWSGASRARLDDHGRLAMTLSLAAGQHHDLVLELSDRALPATLPDPDQAWQATEAAWSSAVPDCNDLVAVRDARHAYAVMSGLTAGTGGMVAAATTSLPERMQSFRNYDYRYSWIRDQCYAGLAVAAHGQHPLVEGALRFITSRLHCDGPDLMPAYTVRGESVPSERNLKLPGYPGGTVRTGNRVKTQFQLDGLGEALQLLAAGARLDMLGPDDWRAAEIAADAIEKRCTEPDAGVWELENRRWAHSRLACAAGLRSIAAAAGACSGSRANRQAANWMGLADKIQAGLSDCAHPTGRWQRSPSDERLDAALVLASIHQPPGADDPRAAATYQAIVSDLTEDGYVYRFRHDARPLHEAEGAFLLCGFWMARAASAAGDPVAAAHWFERSRSAYGPAGLYTEEYDVHQRQLRGNLPQAFVHAGMLAAAVRLSADEVGALGGAGWQL